MPWSFIMFLNLWLEEHASISSNLQQFWYCMLIVFRHFMSSILYYHRQNWRGEGQLISVWFTPATFSFSNYSWRHWWFSPISSWEVTDIIGFLSFLNFSFSIRLIHILVKCRSITLSFIYDDPCWRRYRYTTQVFDRHDKNKRIVWIFFLFVNILVLHLGVKIVMRYATDGFVMYGVPVDQA